MSTKQFLLIINQMIAFLSRNHLIRGQNRFQILIQVAFFLIQTRTQKRVMVVILQVAIKLATKWLKSLVINVHN